MVFTDYSFMSSNCLCKMRSGWLPKRLDPYADIKSLIGPPSIDLKSNTPKHTHYSKVCNAERHRNQLVSLLYSTMNINWDILWSKVSNGIMVRYNTDRDQENQHSYNDHWIPRYNVMKYKVGHNCAILTFHWLSNYLCTTNCSWWLFCSDYNSGFKTYELFIKNVLKRLRCNDTNIKIPCDMMYFL